MVINKKYKEYFNSKELKKLSIEEEIDSLNEGINVLLCTKIPSFNEDLINLSEDITEVSLLLANNKYTKAEEKIKISKRKLLNCLKDYVEPRLTKEIDRVTNPFNDTLSLDVNSLFNNYLAQAQAVFDYNNFN